MHHIVLNRIFFDLSEKMFPLAEPGKIYCIFRDSLEVIVVFLQFFMIQIYCWNFCINSRNFSRFEIKFFKELFLKSILKKKNSFFEKGVKRHIQYDS